MLNICTETDSRQLDLAHDPTTVSTWVGKEMTATEPGLLDEQRHEKKEFLIWMKRFEKSGKIAINQSGESRENNKEEEEMWRASKVGYLTLCNSRPSGQLTAISSLRWPTSCTNVGERGRESRK